MCPPYPRSEGLRGKVRPTGTGYQRAGWIPGHSAQEPGRRTPEPGSCFLEQARDAALKDFGGSLPGSCDLCLSEPLVPESIGNPRLTSLINHSCYLHHPGPRALTLGGIFGRNTTDRNSTASVHSVGSGSVPGKNE